MEACAAPHTRDFVHRKIHKGREDLASGAGGRAGVGLVSCAALGVLGCVPSFE